MLNIKQATSIIKKNIHNANIEAAIVYKNLYIFKVYTDDKLEGQMDPFYSVNIETGEFRDFSILTDGNIGEITTLFTKHSIKVK